MFNCSLNIVVVWCIKTNKFEYDLTGVPSIEIASPEGEYGACLNSLAFSCQHLGEDLKRHYLQEPSRLHHHNHPTWPLQGHLTSVSLSPELLYPNLLLSSLPPKSNAICDIDNLSILILCIVIIYLLLSRNFTVGLLFCTQDMITSP